LAQKPDPVAGLVVRYDYLWRDEQKYGREEGVKTRPCAVVLALPNKDTPTVLMAAITHRHPDTTDNCIEIPPRIKQHLGLDSARSWIILSEVNIVQWDDAGIVPVSKDKWTYGVLPQKLLRQMIDTIITLSRQRKLRQVARKL
jgi:hypothetical protein